MSGEDTDRGATASPRLVAALYEGSDQPGGWREAPLHAAVVALDVQGLGPVAGLIDGEAAADAVVRVVEGILRPAMGRVEALGGEVLAVDGGRLLAWWPAPALDPERLRRSVARAAAAALDLVRTVTELPAAWTDHLTPRAALGAGPVRALQLAGDAGDWAATVGGAPVRDLERWLAAAAPGQVVVAPDTVALLPDRAHVHRADDGLPWLQLAPPPLGEPVEPARPPEAAFAALRPAPVVRMLEGDGAFRHLVRDVLVATVRFPAADGPPQAPLRALQAAVRRAGGDLVGVRDRAEGLRARFVFGLSGGAEARPDTVVGILHGACPEGGAVGLSGGRVFAGLVGTDARCALALLGEPVDRAEDLAAAGAGFRVDEPLRARLAGRFELAPDGEATWRVVARRAVTLARDEGRLFGRRAELDGVAAFLDDAARGTPGVLVLEGPAGLGKSRLALHALSLAEARGVPALVLSGEIAAGDRAWAAWRPVLRRLVPPGPDLDARIAALLPEATPAERALLADPLGVDLGDAAEDLDVVGAGRAERIRGLLVALLRAALGPGTALLVVDDAQWLDPLSADLLHDVAVAGLVAVLTTERPAPDRPGGLLRLHTLPGAELRVLTPLDEATIHAIVADRLGVRAVPSQLVQWLATRAGGNPFLLVQTVSALAAAGVLTVEDGRLAQDVDPAVLEDRGPPATVEGTVTWRLDRLPAATRTTVLHAAVLGYRFDQDALAHVAGRPPGEVAPLLQPALDAELLEALHVGRYRFVHRLTQQAAYGWILPPDRRALHQRAAAWMIDHDGDPGGIARHLLGSDTPREALPHLERAAAQAARRGDVTTAYRTYRRAVELSDRLERDGQPAPPPEARAGWLVQMSEIHAVVGAPPQVKEDTSAALALLDRPVPRDDRGWKRLALGALLSHLAHRALPGFLWRAPAARRPALADAARAYARYAEACFHSAQERLAFVAASLATVALAERADAPVIATSAYGTVAMIAGMLQRERLARRYLRFAHEAASRGEERDEAAAWFAGVLVHSALAQFDEADRARDAALPILRASRNTYLLGPALSTSALNAYLRGRYDEATAMAEELRTIGRDHQSERFLGWGAYQLGKVAIAQGDLDRAVALGEEARARLVAIDDVSQVTADAVVAVAQVRAGDFDGALTAADALAAKLEGAPPGSYTRLEGYAGPAEVYADVLDAHPEDAASLAAGAARALAPLEAFARRFPLGRPRWLHLQARLRRHQGRDPHPDLARALAEAAALGFPLEQARILVARAHVDRTGPDGPDARAARDLLGASVPRWLLPSPPVHRTESA